MRPSSLKRELTLLSRSIYFYVELFMAAFFLVLLLVVMPEKLNVRVTEYYFIDAENPALVEEALFAQDGVTAEEVTMRIRGEDMALRRYTLASKDAYIAESREDLVALVGDKGNVGVVLRVDPASGMQYEYHLQGYETDRYQAYAALAAAGDIMAFSALAEEQPVTVLEAGARQLNDRQQLLPSLVLVNCVLMGIMVAAAYIIEDKKTDVLRALRVTPRPMMDYLLAKVAAVVAISLCTALIITVPVMKLEANYLALLLTVVCGSFLTAALGALIASFFDDMANAFGVIFAVLILLLVPAVAALVPAWDVWLLRALPSHYMLVNLQDAIRQVDWVRLGGCAAAFLLLGTLLLLVSARRIRKGASA